MLGITHDTIGIRPFPPLCFFQWTWHCFDIEALYWLFSPMSNVPLTLSLNYSVKSLQYILGTKCFKFCDCKRDSVMLPMRLNLFSIFFYMVLPFLIKPQTDFWRHGHWRSLNVRSKVNALPRGGSPGISSDGDDPMGQKSKPKKSPGLPTKPRKIPGPKINPQKIQQPQNKFGCILFAELSGKDTLTLKNP